MSHGKNTYILTAGAVLLAMILVTLGLAVTHQPDVVVPVTGEQKPLTDAWVQNAGERVLAAAVEKPVAAAAPQRMDLGAGYTLELAQGAGTIINPVQAKVVDASVKEMYLGGGAWLEPVTGGAKILTIAGAAKPEPVVQRMDLGAGYTLVLEGRRSQIEEAAKAMLPIWAAASAPTRIDIGCGYSLVQQGEDWTMVH